MSSKDRRRSASYVGDVWLPHPTHGWLPAIATEGKAADAADVVIPPCALRKRGRVGRGQRSYEFSG